MRYGIEVNVIGDSNDSLCCAEALMHGLVSKVIRDDQVESEVL